MTSDIV